MNILGLIGGLFGMIGDGTKALFGFKQAQVQTVQDAIKLLGTVNDNDGKRDAAAASIIQAEASSQFWLPANIRPLTCLIFLILLVSYWFGYVPPHLNDPMSPMMSKIFDLMMVMNGGYMGMRTIDKIASLINISSVLKTIVNKKVL